MDLTRPVYYRGLNINVAAPAGPGDPISGIVLEQVMWAGAPGVGYSEKRSLTDGYDASDVYLGRRSLRARATVYGLNRADLYDRKQELMSCMHPTAAYLDDIPHKGYLPLTYEEPTLDPAFTPEGVVEPGFINYKPLMIYARPIAQPDFIEDRDRTGGSMLGGLAIPMQFGWDVIDPRVYVQGEQEYPLDGAGPFVDVPISSRGDYPSPVNVLLVVAAAKGEGTCSITVGTGTFNIRIADSTAEQVYRFSARQNVLTVTEDGQEVSRMDLLDLGTDDVTPSVLPGDGSFTMISDVAFEAGSRLFYNEAFA